MKNPFEVYTSYTDKKHKRGLEWEESALDSQSYVEGFAGDDREHRQPLVLWLVLAVCFVALTAKIFNLQIVNGASFRALSDNNRIRSITVLAPRGLILDRNSQVLVQNTASYNLVAVPLDLPKSGLDAELTELAADFSLDKNSLAAQLQTLDRSSFQPVVLQQGLTQQQSILFETKAGDFAGFDIQSVPIGRYPDPQAFSNILGYTGLVSPGDLAGLDASKYDPNDFIGKAGIEEQYEQYLHGQNGANEVEVDASGHLLSTIGQDEPTPGDQLVLNIDQGLQDRLYHDLADNNPNRKAAAVAIDPRNGQVLALVSIPGYDDNMFAQGITQQQYNTLLNDPRLPLFDRAIAGTYPPGSTSKLMTATAGLQDGVITPETLVDDTGDLIVPNQFGGPSYQFHGWKPGGLGEMNVRSAIALSSDIFFYEVAGGSPNGSMPGLGPDRLAAYFRKFGLGKPLGIDLPGEASGLVPGQGLEDAVLQQRPAAGEMVFGRHLPHGDWPGRFVGHSAAGG